MNFSECPHKDLIQTEVKSLREISELRDNEQEQARQNLIMRFDRYEAETDKKFENLNNKVQSIENKIDSLESSLPQKFTEIINGMFGKLVKWFFIAVIGSGIAYASRSLIMDALTNFIK